MRKIWIIAAIGFALGFSACTKESTDLKVTLRLQYDGEAVVMQEKQFDYHPDYDISFTRVSFYASNWKFTGNGDELSIVDLAYIDLSESHINQESADEGYQLYFEDLDDQSFDQFEFTLGLEPDLNAMKPSDFPSTHPLSISREYWEAWSSYVFMKVEGGIDTDGDGVSNSTFSYHMGGDQVKRDLSLPVQVTLSEGRTELDLIIDLKDVLIKDGEIFDVQGIRGVHTPDRLDIMEDMATRFIQSFRLEE